MTLTETRERVLALAVIRQRREARRPDRFTVSEYCDAVGKGLLTHEPKLNKDTAKLIMESSDDQLPGILARLRGIIASEADQTVGFREYVPAKQSGLIYVGPGRPTDDEEDDD